MPEVLTAPRVMTGEAVIADGAVVIGDAVVRWSGPVHALPAEYFGLPHTHYPGSTIMPGLIDGHVHLGFDGGRDPVRRMRRETDDEQIRLMLRNAEDLLDAGVTTARDLGARDYLSVTVRDAIAAGRARGPRTIVAASPITAPGGHCWFMGGEARGADGIRRIVDAHRLRGADLVKVMLTGGFTTPGTSPWDPQFTAGQLAVLVEAARQADLPIAAHVHGVEGIRLAVESGVTTIEHCSFGTETSDQRFSEALAARLVERGTYVCPTINVNSRYFAEVTGIGIEAHLKAMHQMGVRIFAGTDAGITKTRHHQYVGGLEHLVGLGFQPADVLAMATTEAAEALGLGAVTGRLTPGRDADLLVVEGDPLADIAALRRLRRIIARGRDHAPGRADAPVG